jgi:flagellar P-ring protein precursor FlgI
MRTGLTFFGHRQILPLPVNRRLTSPAGLACRAGRLAIMNDIAPYFQSLSANGQTWHGIRNSPYKSRRMGMRLTTGDCQMAKLKIGRALFGIVAALLMSQPPTASYAAAARIKDIVNIEGIRDNQLVGYGLVVGLNGTGDGLNNSPFTRQSLQAMLERLGVNTRGENMRTANVAAVMVTANLPPFATQGSRLDVSVAAIGDSKSLQGGTLLVTPLLGADGEAYAIAQGAVSINGFSAEGDAATVVSGVPTTGRISAGALIEREIGFVLGAQRSLRLALRNPDLTTSRRIALAINDFIGIPTATPEDPATIRLNLPRNFNGNIVDLLTDIEQLVVETDLPAKIVIDENSGIIVMGKDVRVSTVAVAQSNLTVTITENPRVVQPNPLTLGGQTAIEPRTEINVDAAGSNLAMVNESVSLQQLVDGLNALGIAPRDLIAILQAIKAAGALQAEIELL